jgi:hypothetical protein
MALLTAQVRLQVNMAQLLLDMKKMQGMDKHANQLSNRAKPTYWHL